VLFRSAFTVTDNQGATCGSGSYAGEFSYSVTIEKLETADTCNNDWTGKELKDDITGGTFSMTQGAGRAAFDVSCPNTGDSFRFSTFNVSGATLKDGSRPPGACLSCAPLLPRADFVSSPGVASLISADAKAGYVRLRVFYPKTALTRETTNKTCGEEAAGGAGAATTAGGSAASDKSERNVAQCDNPQNYVVEYFNCSIPAPPGPCEDGVKNNDETDIDCGGQLCTAKCAAGLACKIDNDCQSTSCALNGGLLQCG
jgi:hypothetical protein